jgi:hypothetical protein
MRLSRLFLPLLLLASLSFLPSRSSAAIYGSEPIASWKRASLALSGGYLGFTSADTPQWNGASIAALGGYSIDRFTLGAQLEHAIPINSDGHRNIARAYLNARVDQWNIDYLHLDVGAGVLAWGRTAPRDWTGLEAHITGSVKLAPRLALNATFLHAFWISQGPGTDYDMYRVALIGRAAP